VRRVLDAGLEDVEPEPRDPRRQIGGAGVGQRRRPDEGAGPEAHPVGVADRGAAVKRRSAAASDRL
jgi:hypothetical protein